MTTTENSRADALTDDERIVLKTLANWRGLGNRERSALMKILAAPPVEQPEFTDECADCGCLHPGEYWVHPRVWSGSGMAVDGGKLCLVCLEARLQRRLTVADFPADAAINRCVLWDLSEQPAAAPIYPQGVMDIPPYSPSGSGQSQATSALTWNAPAPAEERAAFVERVMGMFEAWPNGKPGPTDEPESHYRFGYNTALEDVLTALDVGSPTRRAASANETGAEGAAIELLRKFMEYRDSDYVPNVLFDCARTIIDNAMAAAAPIDEPTELEQVIACLGDDAATLRHADEYVEMADNMEAAARLLESSHGEILQKIGGALGLLAGDDLHRHVLPALHGALDDARRWRAFRDRDSFDNLEYVAFQDQFREDADRIIDAAITEKDEDRAGEEMCNRWPWERVTAPSPADERAAFDILAHLQRQREFSEHTFGPGARTAGICDHIRKELKEIEANPSDLTEWIDVVILALDGAWRAGGSPQQIIDALVAKQAKNESRIWPDWRTVPSDKAIEHVRANDAAPGVAQPNRQGDKS